VLFKKGIFSLKRIYPKKCVYIFRVYVIGWGRGGTGEKAIIKMAKNAGLIVRTFNN
jgi:hypothetical protein